MVVAVEDQGGALGQLLGDGFSVREGGDVSELNVGWEWE